MRYLKMIRMVVEILLGCMFLSFGMAFMFYPEYLSDRIFMIAAPFFELLISTIK